MKFLAALILTALLSFVAGLYLPWWGIAIAAFIAALIVYQKAGFAFLAAFSGLLLLWVALLPGLIVATKVSFLQG